MYLPTFWKLSAEAMRYKMRHIAGWGGVATIWCLMIGHDSIYNWVYSTIIPPPRGVLKREG